VSWLTATDRKEELSLAYLRAVAAHVGLYVQEIGKDRDSVDVEVLSRGRLTADSIRSVKLGVQLKARTGLTERDGKVAVPLSMKSYDDLRAADLHVPRILVVHWLPDAEDEQVVWSPTELMLRRCASWYSLKDLSPLEVSPTTQEPTTTVHIPLANELAPDRLLGLMVRVSRREELTDGT
jgi:hypothetical protein